MQTNHRIQLEIRATIQALLSLGSDEKSRKLGVEHAAKYFKTPETDDEIVVVDSHDERMTLSTLLRWAVSEKEDGTKRRILEVLTSLKLNPIVISRQLDSVEVETFKTF